MPKVYLFGFILSEKHNDYLSVNIPVVFFLEGQLHNYSLDSTEANKLVHSFSCLCNNG